jgi:hypothetical protein
MAAAAIPLFKMVGTAVISNVAAKKLGPKANTNAQGYQAALNEQNQQYIKDQYARGSQALTGGYTNALNTTRAYIPQQLQAIQQGNYAAQQSIARSLPQQRAALLGGRVNYGALQPQMMPINTQFIDQIPQNPLGGV